MRSAPRHPVVSYLRSFVFRFDILIQARDENRRWYAEQILLLFTEPYDAKSPE